MSREIKFRAWDKKYKCMFYGNLNDIIEKGFKIKIPTGLSYSWIGAGYTCVKSDYKNKERTLSNELIWLQYTGLKDNNDVGIYEGDIVKTPDNYERFGLQAGEINEVIFFLGGFRLKPKFSKNAKGFWLEDDKTFEIIGNIYENPELLEKKE